MVWGFFEDVLFDVQVGFQGYYDGFVQWVDWWVGDLGELLVEVIVWRVDVLGEDCYWCIVVYGVYCFLVLFVEWMQYLVMFFEGDLEYFYELFELVGVVVGYVMVVVQGCLDVQGILLQLLFVGMV